MAKKTQGSQKKPAGASSNGKKKRASNNARANGHDHSHEHNGHDDKDDDRAEVNWLGHWSKPIKVPEGVTQQQLTKVVRDYLKAWLEAQNLFQTNEKKRFKLKRLNVILKPGSKRSFLIDATLDPPAIPIVTGDDPDDPDGGGHMIPHDPPPPPPKDDSSV